MSLQQQFLDVIDRDEAERRFHAALDLAPLAAEEVALGMALGRVLAEEVRSPVDVPSFDRANVDGYAVVAADTHGASEQAPRTVALLADRIAPGAVPPFNVHAGQAAAIATGGMAPRGADAVVMVEHTDVRGSRLLIRRAVAAGANIAFAGTDIAAGEVVLRAGEPLTSRESGTLAAIGRDSVRVVRQPRVAILSTGDELIAPGERMRPGLVYDSNARILADAVRELGGLPIELGIVRDHLDELRHRIHRAIADCDLVILSGGTSKGEGDLSYRVAGELREPGIVAHGVALKPGKPICLAATRGKAIVVLPGFPTSAIFTFHEFVAPVIRRLAGLSPGARRTVPAELAVKVNSEIGRTEYLLVNLIKQEGKTGREGEASREGEAPAEQDRAVPPRTEPHRSGPRLVAWPMGKGSGSVTTFCRADGFVTIGRHEELLAAGSAVEVTLLARELAPADLVVIGSHCVGVDLLLGELQRRGLRSKFLAVGSTAGLEAAKRGQCDVAGIHLLDPASGRYNESFVTPGLQLVRGYSRMQGIVVRPDDRRFAAQSAAAVLTQATQDPACWMVNRNPGSGTRILIDSLLAGARPAGYAIQPTSHTAVAAAVAQGRADWGVCIESVARQARLSFLPVQEERYDFVVPRARAVRPTVRQFLALLNEESIQSRLRDAGLLVS